MKKTLAILVASLGLISLTPGQTTVSSATDVTDQSVQPSETIAGYQIGEQDGNSRVWQKIVRTTDGQGNITFQTNQAYVELASGLNHLVNGQWVESKEEIDVLPDGSGAVATNGQHQVYFPADIYQGKIKMVTPEGKILSSRPVGLSYDDGSHTVLIAELTNSIGELVGSNQVIYPDAFIGFKADLLYTYTKAGFEQDIILREQPPAPEDFNLASQNCRLQLLTEFFDPPQPTVTTTQLPAQANMALNDDKLDFGIMQMMPGKAFLLGADAHDGGVLVAKEWVNVNGQQILVEEVPVMALADELLELPLPQTTTTKVSPNSPLHVVSAKRLLPTKHLAKTGNKPTFMTKAVPSGKGLVLDYNTVNGSLTNYTFQGDTTYYISGTVNLYGTNTFEGGAVIKYTNNASITLQSSNLNWLATPYRPVIFTAKDDNSVGSTISGSTGSPTNYYANPALSLTFGVNFSNFRIAYAQQAIYGNSGYCTNYNCQFVNCLNGVTPSAVTFYMGNALFANVQTNFNNVFHGGATVQNATFASSTCIGTLSSGGGVTLNNCILANVTSLGTSGLVGGNTNGFYNSPEFGAGNVTNTFYPFQSVGAGSYYLTNGCSFFNAGTTNIDPTLLTYLAQKTTYSPLLLTNQTISVNTNFSPQVQRDTNSSPTLGYHYDPIDYLVSNVTVSASLTLTNGVALGLMGSKSLTLQTNCNLYSEGTPLNLNQLVNYANVQEQPLNLGSGTLAQSGLGTNITASFWFTDFSMPAGSASQEFYTSFNYEPQLSFQDCTLHCFSFVWVDSSGPANLTCTNNLFDRCTWGFSGPSMFATFYNNLFRGGTFRLVPSGTLPWYAQDNLFDQVNLSGSSTGTNVIICSYNGFTLGTTNYLGGSNNITNLLEDYQTGPLGNYYYPTNGTNLATLINAGSTNASALGLYHYTVTTNEAVEGFNTVSIGYHYVALGTNGLPLDSNGDGIPDYLADANGNGLDDPGEIPWNLPVTNMVLWLEADEGVTNSGGSVSGWADQSGNNNNATGVNQPLWVANALNGLPVVQFNGTNSYLNLPYFMNGATQGEGFVVLKTTTTLGSDGALWSWGSYAIYGYVTQLGYPNSDGSISEDFGSGNLYNMGVPAQPLSQYHLYEVTSQTNNWAAWINGSLLYQTNGNPAGFSYAGQPYTPSPTLGVTEGYPTLYFNGDVAEVMVFNRGLTASERVTVSEYLNGKYGLVPAIPATPTNLVATAISTNQISLTWSEALTNGGITQIAVERSTASNGTYQVIAQLTNALSYMDTNLPAGTTYYYQVQALNLTTWSAPSSVAWATTLTNGTSLPLGSLALWLKADSGLAQLSTNTPVDLWADQSGNGENAVQPIGADQPIWVANALNGRPVVQFGGTNYFNFSLPSYLTNLTQGETFVVLKTTTTLGNQGALWSLGSYPITEYVTPTGYPNSDGSISEDFGSGNLYNMGVPAQPLSQYHLYEVTSQTNNWAAWINGSLLYQTNGNPAGFSGAPGSGSPTLGVIENWPSWYYFNGDVAEVMVFNRGLTASERVTVSEYLNGKYGLVPAIPATPTNLVATAISTNQISLTWSEALTNGGITQIAVERSTASNGTYQVIAQLTNALSYMDTNLPAGTTYYYQVQALNLTTWSAPSSVAWATTLTNGTSLPLGSLALWLKADSGLAQLSTNTPVDLWQDQSGNGNDVTQLTGTNQPLWVAAAINGYPVIQFDGTNDYFNFNVPNFMGGMTGVEAFVVLKVAYPTNNTATLWRLGGSLNDVSLAYPGPDGSIKEDFGSTSVRDLGVPPQPLTQYHVYQVTSETNNWEAWINGILLYQTTNNTLGYPIPSAGYPPLLGSDYYDVDYVANNHFAGSIAEILIFNRGLTAGERITVNEYLNGKYGLMPTVPPAPTNLVATAIATNQISLTWSEVLNGGITQISVLRSTSSNGTYQVVAQLSDTTSYVDTNNLAAGMTYYYEVGAVNLTQWVYSNIAQATTPTNGTALPFGSLALWLKADSGLAEIGTNTPVNLWQDQSGNRNDATQLTGTNQPLWVAAAINGYPVIQFNGTNSYFNLPNFLNGATQAEAFVVLNVVTNTPSNPQSLWQMGSSGSSLYPNADGQIVDDFGSASANTMSTVQSLTQYHMYEAVSQPNDWVAWINGNLLYQTSNNTVEFWPDPILGALYDSYDDIVYNYFAGNIAEVLVFNRTLTADERDTVGAYLFSKYNLSQYATNAVPPGAPTNLLATGVAPYQLNLQWVATSTNVYSFHLQRELGTNGNYQEIANLASYFTNFVDITASPTNQYFYRVRAHNLFGDAYSSAISPPSVNITNWPATILENETNLIIAQAADADGSVSNVQFFASFYVNNPLIGMATNSPYTINWMPTMQGSYTLEALAADNQGNSQFSSPVNVSVYLDSNGDGIPDYLQVSQGNDPINPWIPPGFNTNDHTAPVITLLIPTNAVLQ